MSAIVRYGAVALILSCLVLAAGSGCGKKGAPIPPPPSGPSPAREIIARQVGDSVRIWFGIPASRGPRPSQKLEEAELLRVHYDAGYEVPPDPDAFRRRGELVGSLDLTGRAEGGRVSIDDGLLQELGGVEGDRRLRYAVRLRDARGRWTDPSIAADLVPIRPAPAPLNLAAEPTADGVRMRWTAPDWQPPRRVLSNADADTLEGAATDDTPAETADAVEPQPAEGIEQAEAVPDGAPGETTARIRYNIYRALAGGSLPERPLNPQPMVETEYLDTAVVLGETYLYVVRIDMPVLEGDRPMPREGLPAGPLEVGAVDRFPPAPPKGLIRVQEGLAVRLFWDPNPERDVGGYRAYRRLDAGPWRRFGPDPVEQPTVVDRDVEIGQRWSYRVTAIDRAIPPNESDVSEVVQIEIVAEPSAVGGDR